MENGQWTMNNEPLARSGRDMVALPDGAVLNIEAFRQYFNKQMAAAGGAIRPIRVIRDHRREALVARAREYGKEALLEMIHRVAASRFLNGGGNREWSPDIDWLLRPTNFLKVLEGKYNDVHRSATELLAEQRANNRAINRAIEEQVRAEERERRAHSGDGAVTYEEYLRMKERGEI